MKEQHQKLRIKKKRPAPIRDSQEKISPPGNNKPITKHGLTPEKFGNIRKQLQETMDPEEIEWYITAHYKAKEENGCSSECRDPDHYDEH